MENMTAHMVKMNWTACPISVWIASSLVTVDSAFQLEKNVMVTRTVWMEVMNLTASHKNVTRVSFIFNIRDNLFAGFILPLCEDLC
jgi:hypothetical protein